jgi:hypothetical protein
VLEFSTALPYGRGPAGVAFSYLRASHKSIDFFFQSQVFAGDFVLIFSMDFAGGWA